MLRDRLQARLAEMGEAPDYVRLVEELLAIRNTTPALARRLVSQALVMEDRREEWARTGDRVGTAAPQGPGVYVLRSAETPVYVGKAVNLRRRLRAHFAQRRWRAIHPDLARVTDAEWVEVGSELEALLREAELIRTLRPTVNMQVGPPSMATRALSRRTIRDVTVILPSVDPEAVVLVAARTSGETMIQPTRRDGSELTVHVERLWAFFGVHPGPCDQQLSPIVFSWLAGRGAGSTRIETDDLASSAELGFRLGAALRSPQLFLERLVLQGGSDATVASAVSPR